MSCHVSCCFRRGRRFCFAVLKWKNGRGAAGRGTRAGGRGGSLIVGMDDQVERAAMYLEDGRLTHDTRVVSVQLLFDYLI